MERLCSNPIREQQQELMAKYERDRDSAASVTEPCTDCGQPGTEICIFCNELYCEPHAVTHNCVVAQLRQGGMR